MRLAPARLPMLQAQAESLMSLTLNWFSPTGTSTLVNRMEVPTFTAEGTTIGKIQARTQLGANADTTTFYKTIGGVDRPIMRGALHIPVLAFNTNAGFRLRTDWECVVTDVGCFGDPSLYGRRYRVVDVPAKTYLTARRLDVVELDSTSAVT